ncbi:GNAT family N-acetyltransferase [Anaerosporobacter sp.]|uniref:GNAT family N-acetyltransferase n=1 Tax=Anaerosporobacter sp. TaxID=1872529 RepID=UPI002899DD18|nr:GNAT family N-acetyltransferase [Anaerosporobacter sp.]
MIIIEARQKDLEEILQIQHLAFRKEAEDFDDFDIEPMTQTLEVLEEEFKTFLFLKAVNDEERIVGSIRGYIKDGTSYIGKTFVHPDYQGKGIGTEMIKHLEAVNKAARHEINASIRCPQNISLYESLGYVRYKETKTENNGFVYLEKVSLN